VPAARQVPGRDLPEHIQRVASDRPDNHFVRQLCTRRKCPIVPRAQMISPRIAWRRCHRPLHAYCMESLGPPGKGRKRFFFPPVCATPSLQLRKAKTCCFSIATICLGTRIRAYFFRPSRLAPAEHGRAHARPTYPDRQATFAHLSSSLIAEHQGDREDFQIGRWHV
jgi:hypothetical protein